MKELKIDPELRDLLPSLTDEEYKQLEKNIVENGFDKNFPIMEWHGYIADGHNRYLICEKHSIEPVIGTLAYETKEEVMKWMLDIQLGRRNLSPIQRIAVAEKYRPMYEKEAKANQSEYHGNQYDKKSGVTENLPQVQSKKERNPTTDKKLADIADVSEKTYRMGAKILNSDNDDLKKRVQSGETSISAGYKELVGKSKNKKENIDNEITTTIQSSHTKEQSRQQISEETKQICADLKTEKSREYLESIWDYKIAIIECMNADFNSFFRGFVSTLNDMEYHVTDIQKEECIKNAEDMVEQMLTAIEEAKKIKTKEDE